MQPDYVLFLSGNPCATQYFVVEVTIPKNVNYQTTRPYCKTHNIYGAGTITLQFAKVIYQAYKNIDPPDEYCLPLLYYAIKLPKIVYKYRIHNQFDYVCDPPLSSRNMYPLSTSAKYWGYYNM